MRWKLFFHLKQLNTANSKRKLNNSKHSVSPENMRIILHRALAMNYKPLNHSVEFHFVNPSGYFSAISCANNQI